MPMTTRASVASARSAMIQTPRRIDGAALALRSELPPWYGAAANPFIITGYRRPAEPADCLRSVFAWHNETMNIHTHLWPGIFYLVALSWHVHEPYFVHATIAAKAAFVIGCLGAAAMGIFSAAAHTFYVVNAKWYARSWQADAVGIVAVNYSHLYLDSFLLFKIALNSHTSFLIATTVFSLFALVAALHCTASPAAASRWGSWFPICASVPLTSAVMIAAFSSPSLAERIDIAAFRAAALGSLGSSVLVFLSGGVFYIGMVPERFYNPNGIFDFVGSHAIFHLGIVLSISSAMGAAPHLYALEKNL